MKTRSCNHTYALIQPAGPAGNLVWRCRHCGGALRGSPAGGIPLHEVARRATSTSKRRAAMEFLACCALGALAGVVLTLGYFADLPPWVR